MRPVSIRVRELDIDNNTTRIDTMQISQHDIEAITYETTVFRDFAVVKMTITDKDGTEQEFKLFADDLKKLNFINQGIKVQDV